MALVSLKDIKLALALMKEIIERLDEIYHELHDNK